MKDQSTGENKSKSKKGRSKSVTELSEKRSDAWQWLLENRNATENFFGHSLDSFIENSNANQTYSFYVHIHETYVCETVCEER